MLACIFCRRLVIPTERSDEGSQAMRIQRSFTSVQDDKFTKKVFGQHLYRCYAQYEKQHFGPAISLLYSLTFYYVGCIYAADTVYLLSYGSKRHK